MYDCDAASGKDLWKVACVAELLPRMHPGGPNASPTVIGGRIVARNDLGALGCLGAQ